MRVPPPEDPHHLTHGEPRNRRASRPHQNRAICTRPGVSPTLLPAVPSRRSGRGEASHRPSRYGCRRQAYRLDERASGPDPAISVRAAGGDARWQAGQACCGGSGWLGPPDAPGSGATLFSQHSGHSRCGRPCRPCPCSHTKYATPAATTRLSPPPKGRPGALGMRGGIAVHLSIGTAARPGVIARAVPFSVAPSGRIDRTARRRSPRRPVRPASRTALGLGDLAARRRPALVTPWLALVTHRVRDPPLWRTSLLGGLAIYGRPNG